MMVWLIARSVRVFHWGSLVVTVDGGWRAGGGAGVSPEVDTQAGVWMIRARVSVVSARANRPPAVTPRARVRLNAMVAIASQALLALNALDGLRGDGEVRQERMV